MGVQMSVPVTIPCLPVPHLTLTQPSLLLKFAIIQKMVLLYQIDLALYTCWNAYYMGFTRENAFISLNLNPRIHKHTLKGNNQNTHTCAYLYSCAGVHTVTQREREKQVKLMHFSHP